MILKDLVKEISFKEIKERFPVLYPGQASSLKGYEKVYKVLQKKRPRRSSTMIDIEWVKDEDCDDGGYWDVHGKEPNDDTKWALDFSTFSKWLGFGIKPELPFRKDKISFLCHVLWEMTFHGFREEDILRDLGKIRKSMKELKEGKVRLLTKEEVFGEKNDKSDS